MRSGGRVRITAQLIHAPTDRHLWARSYERRLEDVLALQGELSRAIAEEVRITVGAKEARRLTPERAVNPDAYDDYLLGRHHWNLRSGAGARPRARALPGGRRGRTRTSRSPTPAWPSAYAPGSPSATSRPRRARGAEGRGTTRAGAGPRAR